MRFRKIVSIRPSLVAAAFVVSGVENDIMNALRLHLQPSE
jgi:hypothetical protein